MHVCIHKIKCLIIDHLMLAIQQNVFVSKLSIIYICFGLQNSISYFASIVHMDYECLTYFSPVVITYTIHVLCTCLYVHVCCLTYIWLGVCMRVVCVVNFHRINSVFNKVICSLLTVKCIIVICLHCAPYFLSDVFYVTI